METTFAASLALVVAVPEWLRAWRSREWCARARCARRGQCQGDHGLPGMYPGSAWSAWIHAAACGAPCRPAAQAQALGHIQRCLQLLMGAGRCRRGCGRVERTQTSPRLVGCVFCVSVVWCHCSRTLSKRERERTEHYDISNSNSIAFCAMCAVLFLFRFFSCPLFLTPSCHPNICRFDMCRRRKSGRCANGTAGRFCFSPPPPLLFLVCSSNPSSIISANLQRS